MELIKKRLDELVPYENNPRMNDAAVKEVKQSIEQCGYITPIVVDEDNVILAGHTRYEALKELGYTSAECIIAEGLDEDQKRKFRLLDNKVGEIASWDIEKLKEELQGLEFGTYEGFSYLMQDEEKKFEEVDFEFEKIILCPKCGAEVNIDET